MSEHRYIYWRDDMPKQNGNRLANVHLLIGYNQGTIADFQEMAKKLRETFPQAKDEEIRPGLIRRSHTCDGYSIIRWDAYIPQGEYEGWDQIETVPEYSW